MTEGRRVRVGILDSGINDPAAPARAFLADADGWATDFPAGPDALSHGSLIADTVRTLAPGASFAAAQIFQGRMTTTPAAAAAGLDWLVKEGAQVVTLSFGLKADRPVLREACERAARAGVLMVAAVPARGGPVYPAAYPNVISVTGDARLEEGEISVLGTGPDFGAYAWPRGAAPGGRPLKGGASFAVATLAGRAAAFLTGHPGAFPDQIVAHLKSLARFRGAERKTGIAGVILAGGAARRMGGGDKCLLEAGGSSLLARVIERTEPQVDRLLLNANGDPARFAAFDLPVAADVLPGQAGPLAGILTGMAWMRDTFPEGRWLLSVAGDTPLLPGDLAKRLMAAATEKGAPIAMASSGGRRHPVFALWSVALLAELETALGDEGVRKVTAWADRYDVATVDYAATPLDPFLNVNTPDDLATLKKILTHS